MDLSPIGETIQAIKETLPEGVKLVAVSKYHSAEEIQEAYLAGQRCFAESRVQELLEKEEALRESCPEISWHFIGPLQRNKVKYLIPLVSLIESIDSERLLDEVQRQAEKRSQKANILLELLVAQEDTKQGFSEGELLDLLEQWQRNPERWHSIELRGLMCMASHTKDEEAIAREFARCYQLFQEIKERYPLASNIDTLSMGMSGDYPIAVREGATEVRIGSRIFGDRH